MFALYCLWVWWYQICDFFKLTLKKSKELILEERLTETRISPNGNAAEDEIPQNENERKKWIQDVLTEVPARILYRLCICEPEYYAGIQGEQIVAFFVERNPLERLFVPNFDQKNVECFSSDSEEIRKTVELLLRYRFVEQFTFFGRQSNRDYYRLTVLGREISFEVERPA